MKTENHRLFEKSKDYALEYMRTVNQRNVYPSLKALRALDVFKEPPPDGPTEAGKILDMLHQFDSPATIAQTGGRYFGFVNGGAIDVALAAKWLADVWDQNTAMYVLSPIASVLESVCGEWLVDFLGLPDGTAAGFVGGTSIGTLTGLAAGRDELRN
jgi:glutamate/tyrosine decarboxylase-like PLP-dependent enzyme